MLVGLLITPNVPLCEFCDPIGSLLPYPCRTTGLTLSRVSKFAQYCAMRECHLARPSVPHSHGNTTSDLLTLPQNALQHLNIMTLIQFLPGLTLPAPQLQ